MKICAITMVYRDYWALAQWIRHYSKHLGIENLYVVAHGSDAKVNEIVKGANIWTVPRDSLEEFDKRRNQMLNQFQAGLLQSYDWVIRTDADELICVDPNQHGSLKELLSNTTEDAVFATGLDLYEIVGQNEIPEGASVFEHRSAAVLTGNYSKAWAVRQDASLMKHGVKLTGDGDTAYSYVYPRGTFLVHLKFASISALDHANASRKEVARSNAPGVPGWGWKRAEQHALKFFSRTEQLELTDWSTASQQAHEQFSSTMEYLEEFGVIRTLGMPFFAKTILPKWFETY